MEGSAIQELGQALTAQTATDFKGTWYAVVRYVNPLAAELTDARILLDDEDLVLSQYAIDYDAGVGIQVGDTLVVAAMSNGDWVVLTVLSDATGSLDAQLQAVADLSPSANDLMYWTSATALALTQLTAFGRDLLDDADASAARTTLGLAALALLGVGTGLESSGGNLRIAAAAAGAGLTGGAGSALAVGAGAGIVVNADDVAIGDAELLAIAGLTSAANKLPYFTGSGAAALTDLIGAGADWAGYTPDTTDVTLGDGTIVGRYCQVGKLVVFEIDLTWGSTTAYTAGPRFAPPVSLDTTIGSRWFGITRMRDSSPANNYFGPVVLNTATRVIPRALDTSGTYAVDAALSATVPFTWATGDSIKLWCITEAA